MKFTIPLQPITKKNSQKIVRAGRFYKVVQSDRYRQYEKDCGVFIPKVETPIDYPVNVKALYFRGDRRRVDLNNLHAALHDILVKYGVLKDDNFKIIVSTDGSRVFYDKENPRTEVEIEKLREHDRTSGRLGNVADPDDVATLFMQGMIEGFRGLKNE